jgi:hypothetical protein
VLIMITLFQLLLVQKQILVNKSFLSYNNNVNILVNSNVNYFPIVNNTNFSHQGEQITFPIMFPFQQFHNHFQDRIETWLENTFQMRFPVNKFIFLFLLEIVVHSRLISSFDCLLFIQFLLLIHIVYMIAGIKERIGFTGNLTLLSPSCSCRVD